MMLRATGRFVDIGKIPKHIERHLDMNADHVLAAQIKQRQSLFQMISDVSCFAQRNFLGAHFIPFL